jgi:hypothetical protein
MPPLAPVADTVRLDLQYTVGGDTNVRNRLYFKQTTPITNLAAYLIAEALGTTWAANLGDYANTAVTLDQVACTDLSSDTGGYGEYPVGAAGSDNSGECPASLAVVLNFKVQRRYRGGHPKVFLPGGGANRLATPQTWTAEYIALIDANYAGWIAAFYTAAGMTADLNPQVNVSYFEGFTNHLEVSGRYRAVPTPRVTPVVDTIVGYEVNPHTGSQRRRSEIRS